MLEHRCGGGLCGIVPGLPGIGDDVGACSA